MVALSNVNLDEEQDPAVLRAYVTEMRNHAALLVQEQEKLRTQEQEQLLAQERALQAALHEHRRAMESENAALKAEVSALQAEREKMAKVLAYLNRLVWGRRSEKLSREELGQLVLAFGGTPEQAAAETPSVPVPPPLEAETEESDATPAPKKRNHPGRTKLAASLERVQSEPVCVRDGERACKHCAAEMAGIGLVEH